MRKMERQPSALSFNDEPVTDILYALETATGILQESLANQAQEEAEPRGLEQWVDAVLDFSSQYNTHSWAAITIVGSPRVYPNYGDHAGAWAQGSIGSPNEFVVLHYNTPVLLERLDIYETNQPGGIVRILAAPLSFNHRPSRQVVAPQEADYVEVWSGPSQIASLPAVSRIFTPELQRQAVVTQTLKLVLDCRGAGSWCEIDAVKMTGRATTVPPREKVTVTAFGAQMGTFALSPQYSDVTFIVEGQSIPAHRCILSARCPAFNAMFQFQNQAKEIKIDDVKASAFKLMLQYIYTDAVEIPSEQTFWVFHVADKYCLTALKEQCIKEIVRCLQINTVIPIYRQIADLFPDLKTACLRYIVRNAPQVVKQPEFSTILAHRHLVDISLALANID